jgi:cholesterol transport system auxiliary component
LAVLVPDAPARLDVVRVPVQIDDANVAYVKDAQWIDKPARLFRSLLAETIRTRTGRVVIDSDDPALTPETQIRGVLRDFGYDARTSSVVVRFDAIRDATNERIETRRFESVIPGVTAEAGPVGDALNRAANDVAGQVAQWVTR